MKGKPSDGGTPARLASENTAHRGMTRRTMVAGSAFATVAGGLVAWRGTETAEAAAAGGPGPTFALTVAPATKLTVSVWDSEEHAAQMDRLEEMVVVARGEVEAVVGTFTGSIVNYPISWVI